MKQALRGGITLPLGEQPLSQLIGFVILQVIENLPVALERIKISGKPEGKTQDTVDNPRSEEQGPAAVTHMPGVIREGCQITTFDTPAQRT
jgi:hypothetical protein